MISTCISRRITEILRLGEAAGVTSPRLGLDRNLRLAWLDTAAAISARRLSTKETQAALMAALEGQVPGTTPQSGRGKTVTVLRRIWFNVPASNEELRDRA